MYVGPRILQLSFKAYYRKNLVKWWIKMIDDNISLENFEKIKEKKMIPTIRQGIDFISDACSYLL